MMMYQNFGKRLFDLIVTVFALILLSPMLALIAILVRLKLGSPILFRQQRPGRHGRPFTIYKFRTMTDTRNVQGNLLPDAERLTPFGQFLRSASLDELPELINVLKGEMSLVGPRPLLMQYLDRYTPEQMRRHEVLPGITGWAQVSGRNGLSWEQKFTLDVWYVDNQSFWLDLKIIVMTIWKIVKQEGVSQPGHATMEQFKGCPANTSKEVLIIGAGGHGQVVADIFLAGIPNLPGLKNLAGFLAGLFNLNLPGLKYLAGLHNLTGFHNLTDFQVEPIGFLDDDATLQQQTFLGLPVLGSVAQLPAIAHDAVIVAVGDNHTRQKISQRLYYQSEQFVTAIHPTAVIGAEVEIGIGAMICAGVVIGPGSRIGQGVILNTGCTVDHHNRIGDYAHIGPGARLGGDVEIGEGVLVGIGATVMPQQRLDAWSVVGAGAVVTKNIPTYTTAIGVPARVLKEIAPRPHAQTPVWEPEKRAGPLASIPNSGLGTGKNGPPESEKEPAHSSHSQTPVWEPEKMGPRNQKKSYKDRSQKMIKTWIKQTVLRNYFVIRMVSLILTDSGLILFSFFLASLIRFELIAGLSISYLVNHYSYLWLALLIRLPLYYIFGLYDRLWQYAGIAEVMRIIMAGLCGVVLIYLADFFVLPAVGLSSSHSYSILLIDSLLNLFFLGGTRFSRRILRNWWFSYHRQNGKKNNENGTGTLIAGMNDAGEAIVRQIKDGPELGLKILGFVDDNPTMRYMRVHDLPILGRYEDIPRLTDQYDIDTVIIADPGSFNGQVEKIENLCRLASVSVTTMPTMARLLESYIPHPKRYPSPDQNSNQKKNSAITSSIPMSSPRLNVAELQAVNQVLKTRHLSFGPYLTEFEQRFAAYCGAGHAVGVSSGTAGLHLAVIAAGIGEGDLVITTPFSFIASANCLLYEKAIPVFVDIDPDTLNINPDQVAAAVQDITGGGLTAQRRLPPEIQNPKSKIQNLRAILPVHVFGQQVDMGSILEVARRHELTVIEDACEAIGAEYKGHKAGTLGDIAVFAFYPNKQMTTGEGGMIVTDNEDWANLFRSLRNQGRDIFNAWLHHTRLGYNYRLDEMSAALGVAQLGQIEQLLTRRAQVAGWYNERLQAMPGVQTPYIAPTTNRMSWFVYVIRLAPEIDRDAVMTVLKERGIPSRSYFNPIHLQPFYREKFGYREGDFPVTESVARSTLALPFFGNMSEAQVDIVCNTLQETIAVTLAQAK